MSSFLTVKQAAEHIGCSQATLNRYRWKGNGPPYYSLAGIRYDRAELDEWIRTRRRQSTSEAA
ncbi:MAG: helix-turn-helix domain-containing protein [Sphingopyxis terrae]|nr:helix-turn-helix domain-containing protein [Sphingopyxis terrae]